MPKSSADTRTQLADRGVNAAPTVAGIGQVVHLVLTFEGRQFVPEALFDALATAYGAGKVSSDTDTIARNNYRLRIKA